MRSNIVILYIYPNEALRFPVTYLLEYMWSCSSSKYLVILLSSYKVNLLLDKMRLDYI